MTRSDPSLPPPEAEPEIKAAAAEPSPVAVEPKPAAPKRRQPLWLFVGKCLGTVVGVYLAILVVLGIRWSAEPAFFDVETAAQNRAVALGISTDNGELPGGFTTVSTMMTVLETTLHKPGGFLANDRMPPGVVLDNLPRWEFGVLTQLRDFASTLRQDLSRARAQSEERPELTEAEARLNYEHEAWMLPSAESEYGAALEHLEVYLQALAGPSGERAVFASRPDSLVAWLRRVESRLGGLTVRLRASGGGYQYDPQVMTSADLEPDVPPEGVVEGEPVADTVKAAKTPRFNVDDVFYEARGAAWALYHLLKAMRYDLEPVIDQQRAMGSMNRALSELYAAIQPVRAPMILNGSDFGMAPNHSITLAAYLAKAHLAIADLRALLSGGGMN